MRRSLVRAVESLGSFSRTCMRRIPNSRSGIKTASVVLNVRYARPALRVTSTNLRHLKSVCPLLPTADRLEDSVCDVGGSLEEAGLFGLRRLIEWVSLIG